MNIDQGALAGVPTRRLGRTGWAVKPVGLGGAWLRRRYNDQPQLSIEEAAETVVAAVREAGIDFIDTSVRYGDSELVIGCALAQLSPTERPRLATKSQVIREPEPAGEGVYQSCLNSLQRLGVDKVDLFQLHEAPEYSFERIMGPGGALEGLRRCRDEGLCERIGVTGKPASFLARLVETGEFDTVLTFYEYDLSCIDAERELLPACQRHDVGVIAGSVARMGLFARPNDRTLAHQPAVIQHRIRALERELGVNYWELADLSLRFAYSDERIHHISVGSSQLGSLLSSIAAIRQGGLEEPLLSRLREIARLPEAAAG